MRRGGLSIYRVFAVSSLFFLGHNKHLSNADTIINSLVNVGPLVRATGSNGLCIANGTHNEGTTVRRLVGSINRGNRGLGRRVVFVARNSYCRSTGFVTTTIGAHFRIGSIIMGYLSPMVTSRSNPKALTVFFVNGREWVWFKVHCTWYKVGGG